MEKYADKLAEIDLFLKLNPQKVEGIYGELLDEAHSTNNQTLEAVLYIYKGSEYYYVGQNQESITYFDKAINLADKVHNTQLKSTASIRRLLVLDEEFSDSRVMIGMLREEFDFARENLDTLNMIYSLNGIALNYEELDSTELCISNYLEALNLARQSSNEFEEGILLNNLGLVKLEFDDKSGALKDFKEGLRIAKKANDIRLELTVEENIGFYYMRVDSLEKAREVYERAYQVATENNYAKHEFNSLVNLGVVERHGGDFVKSDSLMHAALATARKNGHYYGVSAVFLNMASLAIHSKEYDRVQPLLDSAVVYSKFTSRNRIEDGVYTLNYLMYKNQGDYETALEYYKLRTQFRDSIDKKGQAQIITELQLKYDVEKEERKRIQDKIEYDAIIQQVVIGIIILLLIIAALVIYYFKQKHKRESEFSSALVNRLEEERGRIARDLHDGLGQSMIVLKNNFNKLALEESSETEQINQKFTETIEEVRSISRSLIPPELRRFGLLKAIRKMCEDIETASGIIVTHDVDALNEIKLASSDEIRVYRIIQELLNNTLKHSGATALKLEIDQTYNGFELRYFDNGKGLDLELDSNQDTLGLRSIHQRLKYLNGTIKIDRQSPGFRAIIKVKNKR